MFDNNKSVASAENLSAMYDGEKNAHVAISEDAKKHMQNWSLIASTMRGELSKKVDIDLANKIALKLNLDAPKINEIKEDQSTVEQVSESIIGKYLRRTAIAISQVAVAASVTICCIVGYQTYLASNVIDDNPVLSSNTSIGEVSGLSLASYQNQNYAAPMNIVDTNTNAHAINEYKKKELDHIHQLVNGYVFSDSRR